MEKYQEIAAKAAAAIEFHGHTKGTLFKYNGSMCFIGGIIHAVNTKDVSEVIKSSYELAYPPEVQIVANCAYRLLGCHVTTWNDKNERTADEVIHLLKRIANGEGAE